MSEVGGLDPALARAAVDALQGIHAATAALDATALAEKGGPARWARSYDVAISIARPRRAEAARRLVDYLLGDGHWADHKKVFADTSGTIRAAGLTSAPAPSLRSFGAHTKAELSRLRSQSAIVRATAILVGWGLSRASARNALRGAASTVDHDHDRSLNERSANAREQAAAARIEASVAEKWEQASRWDRDGNLRNTKGKRR